MLKTLEVAFKFYFILQYLTVIFFAEHKVYVFTDKEDLTRKLDSLSGNCENGTMRYSEIEIMEFKTDLEGF